MRPFKCRVLLYWISVHFLLYGSAASTLNISTQNQLPNGTSVQDEEDSGWDHLRASLPSYSQPIRPYTLLTNPEDYHHMPKARHNRPSRFLRLLGSSFNPFWMSIKQPNNVSNMTRGKIDLRAAPELREAAARHRRKLEKEAANLDLGSLPIPVASSVREWLVHSATCGLRYQWVDLGPAFWPRWLRHTDCERSDEGRSCSFPGGLECVRAQTGQLKILAWHCPDFIGGGSKSGRIKENKPVDSTESGTGGDMKRCLWRQVPYPVVTACVCSCK